MKSKNGMAVRTFAFALILMTMVLVVILGILYVFLPSYYYRHKNRELERNVETLRARLDLSLSLDELNRILNEFSVYNNANIIVIDHFGNIIPSSVNMLTIARMQEHDMYIIGGSEPPRQLEWFAAHGTLTGEGVLTGDVAAVRVGAVQGMNLRFTNIIMNIYEPHPELSQITIIAPLQPIDEAQAVIISMLPYLAGAGFVTAFGLAFLFVKRETKRVAKLEAMKTDFMRAAGHELKTPIAALSGMLEGMMDEVGAYKDRDKYLAECKIQVERLSRLTADILKTTQAGDVIRKPQKETVDISAPADELMRTYAPLTEKKQLSVTLNISENFTIETDKQMFFTALSNLMSNAVKYTPEGGNIAVGTDKNVFYIENECEITNPAAIQSWFEPFYRPDYSRDKTTGGTGLGLYLVKKNLDALGMECELKATDNGVRAEICFIKSSHHFH